MFYNEHVAFIIKKFVIFLKNYHQADYSISINGLLKCYRRVFTNMKTILKC